MAVTLMGAGAAYAYGLMIERDGFPGISLAVLALAALLLVLTLFIAPIWWLVRRREQKAISVDSRK